MPLEIFFRVCEDLPPSDLLALMQTCSRFHFILMDDGTQQIWKKARTAYFKGLQRPPPPNWNVTMQEPLQESK
ncbi:13001_t:CDS:2 [Entrophospora sp. SA101]|nr:13001_t:CDS:2 [Entrophospora sp. SA101]